MTAVLKWVFIPTSIIIIFWGGWEEFRGIFKQKVMKIVMLMLKRPLKQSLFSGKRRKKSHCSIHFVKCGNFPYGHLFRYLREGLFWYFVAYQFIFLHVYIVYCALVWHCMFILLHTKQSSCCLFPIFVYHCSLWCCYFYSSWFLCLFKH